MSTLILPICGESTRYPNMPPKWSIMMDGQTMLERSIAGLPLESFDQITVIMLRKHLEYKPLCNIPYNVIYLKQQTSSQVETVYKGLIYNGIAGPIVIKDCDNYFVTKPVEGNFVAYSTLSGDIHNAENKSYIEINEHGIITNIIEKRVISPTFCCGMYGFQDAEQFVGLYKNNRSFKYISDVIFYMILHGIIFYAVEGADYVDWGTLEDFKRFQEELT